MTLSFARQRAVLREELERVGLSKEWKKLEPFVRDSIALKLGKKAKTSRIGSSRLGGAPDLPASHPWPESNGAPLSFLGQFALADVQRLDERRLLPASGLLTVFAGHQVDQKGVFGPVAVVQHLEKGPSLKPVKAPRGVDVHEAISVTLEARSQFWPFGGRGPKVKDPFATLCMRLADVGGPTRHHALFGTDRPREGLVDPAKEEVLLRLDRDQKVPWDFEEAAVLYLVAPRKDLMAGRFGRVRAVEAFAI